ncbi:MAG TPA: type II toxin-antitoxin system MqsA family antitoxin [Nitrospira sp.]|nr:type II toxin-antitoxin system MqsA family antitoxin [Nitrospira sp.]
MKCHVCGAELKRIVTDMPFKTGLSRIVIIKQMPVFQCEHCGEYVLADDVMGRIEIMLAQADRKAELEILQYAA